MHGMKGKGSVLREQGLRKVQCRVSGKGRQRRAFIDRVESQERAVPDRDELELTEWRRRVRKGHCQTEVSFN